MELTQVKLLKIDQNKITVVNDFFPTKKRVNKISKTKFNIITSIAMFYDLDNPNLFVKEIKKYLDKKESGSSKCHI